MLVGSVSRSYNSRMDQMDQASRDEHELLAQRIESGTATPEDLSMVLALLGGMRRPAQEGRQPRLDSADDFETWVVRPGLDGLNLIHRDMSGEEHVVGYEDDRGQGHGQASRIGAAMWAAFVRATRCPELDPDEEMSHDPNGPRVHVVSHHYQIGNLSVAVEIPAGLDASRIAAFIQLACEEWHDQGAVVLPQTVVEALIRFYGCSPAPMPSRYGMEDEIDLYWKREQHCGEFASLMADDTLAKDGLREFLKGRYHS